MFEVTVVRLQLLLCGRDEFSHRMGRSSRNTHQGNELLCSVVRA